jgi:inner membrane transporter RhtA
VAALVGRLPPVALVLAAIVSVQFGAGFSATAFDEVGAAGMTLLRLGFAAIVMLAVWRPRPRAHTREALRLAVAFGLVLGVMNLTFYEAVARIPLGIAVTIEFLGPLAVAVIGSRRPRDVVWVVLAGTGVALLGLAPASLNWAGVGFALLAGLGWACYILLSAQTGRQWPGVSGLAVASLVGAVVLAPPAILEAGATLLEPRVLLLGLAVGLLSSVIPYSLELTALRRITPRLFSILMSLEPAVAALAAILLLREFLTPLQWVAMACVVVASVGATRTAEPMRQPAPD